MLQRLPVAAGLGQVGREARLQRGAEASVGTQANDDVGLDHGVGTVRGGGD